MQQFVYTKINRSTFGCLCVRPNKGVAGQRSGYKAGSRLKVLLNGVAG